MAKPKLEYVTPAASKGLYDQIRLSEAVKVGNTLYVSGQVGWDPRTMKLVEGGLKAQARKAFQNMKTVVEEAGGRLEDIVQFMVFIVDGGAGHAVMDEFNEFFEVKNEFLPEGRPSGTGMRVTALALPGQLIEIQAIVAL